MPIEERLEKATQEIEQKIKVALLEKNMTQKELADLIHENRSQVNLAVKGDSRPKSIEIRKKIYRILGMEWLLWK